MTEGFVASDGLGLTRISARLLKGKKNMFVQYEDQANKDNRSKLTKIIDLPSSRKNALLKTVAKQR